MGFILSPWRKKASQIDPRTDYAAFGSLDVYRPAAQEQLAQLAEQIGGASLPIVAGQKPLDITKRALDAAKKGGYDVLILDTAGRLHIDDDLMNELVEVKKISSPAEILPVSRISM